MTAIAESLSLVLMIIIKAQPNLLHPILKSQNGFYRYSVHCSIKVNSVCTQWFTVKKAGIFLIKKGTFYRVCGPEIPQVPQFGRFLENLSAGSVANVPFFQKIFEKKATLSQCGGMPAVLIVSRAAPVLKVEWFIVYRL